MAGWYNNSKNNKLDIDLKEAASNGALTTKAVGDAFMGVAQVVEDRKKLDILEADAKTRDEKNKLELSKLYGENTQKAIDDTYLNYVDTNTGKFDQERFDKDNVGLPMNQVSLDAKLKQKELANLYTTDLEKIDKKAQEEISNEVLKEMFKYGSKDEFNTNVNPDLIRYANGTTMVAVDKFYNDKSVQEARLANAAAKLENTASMNGLKMDLKKKELEIEQEKLENKKNAPKEVKAADDSLIGKNIALAFGGVYDPGSGEIKGLDKDLASKVSDVSAKASKYYKENQGLTHNEASALALKDYEDSMKKPEPTQTNNKDPFGWLNK